MKHEAETQATTDQVRTSLPTRSKGRKTAVIALLLVIGLVILFFFFVFPFGMWVSNPWGQEPGPGP